MRGMATRLCFASSDWSPKCLRPGVCFVIAILLKSARGVLRPMSVTVPVDHQTVTEIREKRVIWLLWGLFIHKTP